MAVKNAKESEVLNCISNGGKFYVEGCLVYIDNPNNFDCVEAATGFWITNAMGLKTYFKCPDRKKAQMACNKLYGAGVYTVNSKI